MNQTSNSIVGISVLIGFVLGISFGHRPFFATSRAQAQTQPARPLPNPELEALRSEFGALKSQAPDQAHAMADVGYHFSNLWFAGQYSNWALAKFYFDETRSHLNWAVRIKPLRKNNAGQDVDLKAILEGIDNTLFTGVKRAIEAKDGEKFALAYRHALEGCYSCHQASDKPYLRPQIPTQPDAHIINFDPDAK